MLVAINLKKVSGYSWMVTATATTGNKTIQDFKEKVKNIYEYI